MALGKLGKYERQEVIGHGATGIVTLARDTLMDRQVALKEIAAQGAAQQRVLAEARVLNRLHHPHIVAVHSVDLIEGKVVIDMEYVAGRNVQDVLRETPRLPFPDAIRIITQVCDALAYAHRQDVIHRDIKPANIILTESGDVKLVDFGLAEVLAAVPMAEGAGGTYAYMAPEDFDSDGLSGPQSDIWATGVVLFEMLAGHRPFRVLKVKDPDAWKRAVTHDPIPDLAAIRPDAPPELSLIVTRALTRDAGGRYQDAAQIADELKAVRLEVEEEASEDADETEEPAVLDGFPGVATIDDFLAAAPGQWEDARGALQNGDLGDWLIAIGEGPLAVVADGLAVDEERDGDEKLREFLYRAGADPPEGPVEAGTGLREIALWYFPLLVCGLAPATVGLLVSSVAHGTAVQAAAPAGCLATAALCLSLFLAVSAARTRWPARVIPACLAALCLWGLMATAGRLNGLTAWLALLQAAAPAVAFAALQTTALRRRWRWAGVWQVWAALTAVMGLGTAWWLERTVRG